MSVQIESINRQQTRDLILSARGGILTELESKTLDACLGFATHLWIGQVDGKMVCAWGLVPPSLLAEEAYLWLYSTPEVADHKFVFVRYSQLVMKEMLRIYPRIVGVTDIKSTNSTPCLTCLRANFVHNSAPHTPFSIEP